MQNYHIAVIDIGKTNKKILIYNSGLMLIDKRFKKFDEKTEDGINYDDVKGLWLWILATLRELGDLYQIRVISVSTHGATFVTLDEQGDIAAPEVSYTTDPGEDFHKEFYAQCGDRIELQKRTGTPDFKLLINLAKGIFFVQKKFPEQFKKARWILHYPQYFGFKLTGNASADPTYTGNHSYMWNFDKRDWSEVADKLGVRGMLPQQLKDPWDILGTLEPEVARATGLDQDVIVTVGIHDSNASMLPYLVTRKDDFLLNSTGTWCVIMHEKDHVTFAPDELGKVVFYNMNAFFKPIKTAIFLGGLEYAHYMNLLGKIHGDTDFASFDLDLYQKVISARDKFILPSVAKGIGQFPDSRPRIVEGNRVCTLEEVETGKAVPEFFRDFKTACAVLNLSMAVQTKVAFDRADMTMGLPVYTEGGFTRNEGYNALMASFFPESRFYLTNLKEATAYGAAMVGKAAMEQVPIKSMDTLVQIEKSLVPPAELEGIGRYLEQFMKLL